MLHISILDDFCFLHALLLPLIDCLEHETQYQAGQRSREQRAEHDADLQLLDEL